jgi:hypothetical protein
VIEAGSTTLATNVAVFDTGSTATVLPVNAVPTGVYYVRVRARNAFGSSAASNEIAIVVGPLPGAPADLSANVIGSSVHLTWRAPASGVAPSSYIIEAGASRGASNLAVIDTAFDGPAFSTHNVPSGVYYVRVRARNAFGSGLASNEVTVVVGSQ